MDGQIMYICFLDGLIAWEIREMDGCSGTGGQMDDRFVYGVVMCPVCAGLDITFLWFMQYSQCV